MVKLVSSFIKLTTALRAVQSGLGTSPDWKTLIYPVLEREGIGLFPEDSKGFYPILPVGKIEAPTGAYGSYTYQGLDDP